VPKTISGSGFFIGGKWGVGVTHTRRTEYKQRLWRRREEEDEEEEEEDLPLFCPGEKRKNHCNPNY